MSDLRQKDNLIQQNRDEQAITQCIAQKLAHLDSARRPQGQPRRVGVRMVAQTYGLQTDDREWKRDGSPAPLAHDRAQPAPVGADPLDATLERRAGFNLHRRERYSLQEASSRLREAFGDAIDLRGAAKQRLHELGLLQDNAKPAVVPEEFRQLKQAIQRQQAEEARPPRQRSLQERLLDLKRQIDALLEEGQDDGEGENSSGWEDPRRKNYVEAGSGRTLKTAKVRTDSRGRLVDRRGEPITIKGTW